MEKWSTFLVLLKDDWKDGQELCSCNLRNCSGRLGGRGGKRPGSFPFLLGRLFWRKNAVGELRSNGTVFFTALEVVHFSTKVYPLIWPHLYFLLSGFYPSACPFVHRRGFRWPLRRVWLPSMLRFGGSKKEALTTLQAWLAPPFGLGVVCGRLRRPPCFSN